MRKLAHSSGVTLLEIMLVLAIAATIIVMSIRYYQSANTSQQVNVALQQLQAYMAAADNLSVGSGSYKSVDEEAIKGIVGANNSGPPGTLDDFSGTETNYTMKVKYTPNTLCNPINSQLKSMQPTKVTNASCSTGMLTFTYTPY